MYSFLMVHIVISLIFYIYNIKKNRDEAICKFLVVFLIPVFGFMYFIMIFILKSVGNDYGKKLQSYESCIKEDVPKNLVRKTDINKEMNIVPAKEALILNESKVKRSLLIDIVKENSEDSISILRNALENSDTEVSHYAATAIAEFKNYYMTSIQDLAVKYEKNKNDIDILVPYVEIIKKYLNSELLDEKSLEKYKYLYSEKLGELLTLDESQEKYFIEKINCDIELNNFYSAKDYCNRFYKAYNKSEAAYIMYMKLYYGLRDYKNFKRILDILKKSNIRFSNNTLNITRFWTVEDMNE